MLNRMFVLNLILLSGLCFFNAPLEASTVELSLQKEQKITKIINVISKGKQLRPSIIEFLAPIFRSAPEEYLDEELFSAIVINKNWSEENLVMVFSHLLETPAESFHPMCAAVQKITTSKPLYVESLFYSGVKSWDAVSFLKLFDGLKKSPHSQLEKAVTIIMALSHEQVWSIDNYEEAIEGIARIQPDRLDSVLVEIKEEFEGSKANVNKSQSNKLDFLRKGENLMYSDILEYFCNTTKAERRLIVEVSKFIASPKKHPLEHQAHIKKHIINEANLEALEIFSGILNRMYCSNLKIESGDMVKLYNGLKKINPAKVKMILSVIDKLSEGFALKINQYEHFGYFLNKYSITKMERFLEDLLPIILEQTTNINQRVQVVKDLVDSSPRTFKTISILASAGLGKDADSQKTLDISVYCKAIEQLNLHTQATNEGIASAAVEVMKLSPGFKGSNLNELIKVLDGIPSGMLKPIIRCARLANEETKYRDDLFLMHTIQTLSDNFVSIERMEFVCEFLSRVSLHTYGGFYQNPGTEGLEKPDDDLVVQQEWRGVVNVLNLMDVTRLIPQDQIQAFLMVAIDYWNKDLNAFRHKYDHKAKYLKAHSNRLLKSGDTASLNALFHHWHKVLLSGDLDAAKTIITVIQRKMEMTNLFGQDFLNLVLITEKNLSDSSWSNPYALFEGMKLRKKKEIDFGLGNGKFIPEAWVSVKDSSRNKRFVSLKCSPEAIYKFSTSMRVDLKTVPQVTSEMFLDLLCKMNDQLDQGLLSENWDHHELKVLIAAAINIDSHMHVLMTKESSFMPTAYLKCIVDYYQTMPDGAEKWNGLVSFLTSVRGCHPGQEAAIEKIYFMLAPKMTNALSIDPNLQDRYLSVYQIVNRALQAHCLSMISEESPFMRKICQLDEGEIMYEPSHQLGAVKGLIGDFVGLPSALKYDQHGGVLYPVIRNVSCQDLVVSYYSFFNVREFLKNMKSEINKNLRELEMEKKGQSSKLCDFLGEDAEASLVMRHDNDEDVIGKFDGLSSYGVATLLNKIGIVEPLPW